jgi:hypothetical protein
MKRVNGLVIVFCVASLVSGSAVAKVPPPSSAAAKQAAAKQAAAQQAAAQRAAAKAKAAAAAILLLAPADEYFGPLKQSVVGIRNEIRVLGWNYDVNHEIGAQTYSSAQLTERAIRDWANKYPRDGQIPRALFLIQRLYTKVLTQQSRDHAHVIAQWLFVSYGKSPQARQLRKTLAVEHLAAIPPPVTPTPVSPYQSVFGPQYSSVFSATANTEPVESATPVPAPTASPAPAPAASAHI